MKLNPINPVLPVSRQGAEQRQSPNGTSIGDTFSNLLDAVNRQQIEAEAKQTELLGGVAHPSVEDLLTMRKGSYILHARGGKLSKVPAEKTKLPYDPKGHIQAVSVVRAPDGSIYAKQETIWCKSTDGGRTWSSYKQPEEQQEKRKQT